MKAVRSKSEQEFEEKEARIAELEAQNELLLAKSMCQEAELSQANRLEALVREKDAMTRVMEAKIEGFLQLISEKDRSIRGLEAKVASLESAREAQQSVAERVRQVK